MNNEDISEKPLLTVASEFSLNLIEEIKKAKDEKTKAMLIDELENFNNHMVYLSILLNKGE